MFGTIDTWLIWNLTGGVNGGIHVTDVSNASRTMLMDLDTLDWNADIAGAMGIPGSMLPSIRASSEVYGIATGDLAGVPIAGDLGDQQAALFGQACFSPGEAKNTYGTGNFMVLNTGTRIVPSRSGLLTTVAYKLGDQPAVYALEGSIAITGALVQWLRDNLGLIETSPDIETLAASVDDNGGVYFVPAFSGLFAPYWRSDARGVIAGLTRYVTKGHIARAALEATAWQTREVLDAMNADSGLPLTALRVDGGMVFNNLLMQFQADVLGVPVIRPAVAETTALGAAYAAGLAVGYWAALDDLRENWTRDAEWTPGMDEALRDREYARWKKAVTRTFDWVDKPDRGPIGPRPTRPRPGRSIGGTSRGGDGDPEAHVGLVVVSHSAGVAEGAAELAGQMAGPDVRIMPAGGLEDGSIGTDAARIAAAIGEADAGAGVVVLVDLGSAVLSAVTALEMLGDPDTVRLSKGPIVEGAVVAAVQAGTGSSLAEVLETADAAASLPKG